MILFDGISVLHIRRSDQIVLRPVLRLRFDINVIAPDLEVNKAAAVSVFVSALYRVIRPGIAVELAGRVRTVVASVIGLLHEPAGIVAVYQIREAAYGAVQVFNVVDPAAPVEANAYLEPVVLDKERFIVVNVYF